MESLRARTVHVLLFLYIAVSLTYQIVATVSLIVGYFDLRHQVQAPFDIDFQHHTLSKLSEEAKRAGLVNGDTIEFLNSAPYCGRAQWQRADSPMMR